MDSLLRDLRFSAGSLLKRPTLTIISVITLAIGIGANSAIFSVVNALLIKPLPFPELDHIVAIWEKQPSQGMERNEVALANYLDWRSQNKSFEQIGLYRWWSTNLTGIEPPERVQGFLVSANFFDVVGMKPTIGRGFTADEDQSGKNAVAILTHGLWQRRFAGDPNITNKTIGLNGCRRTGGRFRFNSVAGKSVVRGDANRCSNLCSRHPWIAFGRAPRLLHPGATRNESRSAASATVRVRAVRDEIQGEASCGEL